MEKKIKKMQLKFYELEIAKTQERIKALKSVQKSQVTSRYTDTEFKVWLVFQIKTENDSLKSHIQALDNLVKSVKN